MNKKKQKKQNQESNQQEEKTTRRISGRAILGAEETEKSETNRLSRRGFIGTAGAFGLGLLTMSEQLGKGGVVSAQTVIQICERAPLTGVPRANQAQIIRNKAASYERYMPIPTHPCNNDDANYANDNYYGSYTKGLKRAEGSYIKDFGEADPNEYRKLLAALASGNPADFEAILLGCTTCTGIELTAGGEVNDGDSRLSTDVLRPNLQRRLSSPQAGLNYDLEGKDYYQLINRPPRVEGAGAFPKAFNFRSDEEAVEIIENYWQALTRDVAFVNYRDNPVVRMAAEDLNQFLPIYFGPIDDRGIVPAVTPRVYSRGILPGDTKGPFLSQFFLRDIPYGAQTISARIKTPKSGVGNDFMTTPDEWRMIQTGQTPNRATTPGDTLYIRNGRDLTEYVRNDAIYQAYLNAALLLVVPTEKNGLGVPINPNNPYRKFYKKQANFVELGISHLLSLLGELSVRAHKAIWYQKWNVHRRIRPEEFGGRIHTHAVGLRTYDLSPIIKNSLPSPATLPAPPSRVFIESERVFRSYFLPQAYPEGSPLHPAYGSGHAILAGACVTLLKAWFDSELPYLRFGNNLFEPTANGNSLQIFNIEDPRDVPTVADELNKLASNVSVGRNIAGIHWRSDYTEAVLLGEQVAIQVLEDYGYTYNEFFEGFRFRNFSGEIITVGGSRQ